MGRTVKISVGRFVGPDGESRANTGTGDPQLRAGLSVLDFSIKH